MIRGLFGAGTITNKLRGGLEEASATHRGISARVAGALDQSASGDFAGQLEARLAKGDVDLEREMASLADTQLRYEAAAKLLQKSYSDLRMAARDRG